MPRAFMISISSAKEVGDAARESGHVRIGPRGVGLTKEDWGGAARACVQRERSRVEHPGHVSVGDQLHAASCAMPRNPSARPPQ